MYVYMYVCIYISKKNWDVINAFVRLSHFARSIKFTTLASACNFWVVFLQREET